MFRCEWCENLYDKSECYESPMGECGLICFDCLQDYEEKQQQRNNTMNREEKEIKIQALFSGLEDAIEPFKETLSHGNTVVTISLLLCLLVKEHYEGELTAKDEVIDIIKDTFDIINKESET